MILLVLRADRLVGFLRFWNRGFSLLGRGAAAELRSSVAFCNDGDFLSVVEEVLGTDDRSLRIGKQLGSLSDGVAGFMHVWKLQCEDYK